jgi:hypothetical protein
MVTLKFFELPANLNQGSFKILRKKPPAGNFKIFKHVKVPGTLKFLLHFTAQVTLQFLTHPILPPLKFFPLPAPTGLIKSSIRK